MENRQRDHQEKINSVFGDTLAPLLLGDDHSRRSLAHEFQEQHEASKAINLPNQYSPAALGFFSDETPAFRIPEEPDILEDVTIRLRVEHEHEVEASLVMGDEGWEVPMSLSFSDTLFDWYEATIKCGLDPIHYHIRILSEGHEYICRRGGARRVEDAPSSAADFKIVPGSHTPDWCRGAVLYQIFPDRFANGFIGNEVEDGEYAYNNVHVLKHARWDEPISPDDYRCFYGGDLQGILDKLDYIQSLGVEALYLNPIFVAPSSHKYDTQDYEHIDPHLAVIEDDAESKLDPWCCNNSEAERYITRTVSEKNLTLSDELFARLCDELHRRGMRIILDGVFNHCGSFSRWMDREGIYRKAGVDDHGAFGNWDSPYRSYFKFDEGSPTGYEAWWNFPTLPKLDYEDSPDLVRHIMDIGRKWASPPYSIDGWRLDVAADLGHTEEYNHLFWKRFREELKQVNPELLIVAEHYGDATPWLGGDEWDTVMNYDAFMDPLTYFLTGMEKHSDSRDDELYQDGGKFWVAMQECMPRFGWGSLLSAMNELSNHDHSRFLTRTNRTVGRLHTSGSEAAGAGVDVRVMMEAVLIQMAWPGAPTIYYGDEAGVVGWTDPDCRRTFPWGQEDKVLVNLHKELTRIRRGHPALRLGSFIPLGGGHGWLAFGRFLEEYDGGRDGSSGAVGSVGLDGISDWAAVVCNNLDEPQAITLRMRALGIPDGYDVRACIHTAHGSYDLNPCHLGRVADGCICFSLPAKCAVLIAD